MLRTLFLHFKNEWHKIQFHINSGDDNDDDDDDRQDDDDDDDDGDDDDVHKAGRLDSIPGDLASWPLS